MLAKTIRVSVLLLCLTSVAQVHADSSTSSAASTASQSVGSLSNSVGTSSKSSTGDKTAANGNYRVIDVVALQDRPGMVRVSMQANAEATGHTVPVTALNDKALDLWLDLPQAAWANSGLTQGDWVNVRNREHGLVFARAAATPQAAAVPDSVFFLALRDAWRNDLDPRAVTL
jgi:hypothetical protein